MVSADVHVDVSVFVLPGQSEGLCARRPFGRKRTISRGDLKSDPLEGLIGGEPDR
jgi:hypothetical protein